jgi:hypothetical protein
MEAASSDDLRARYDLRMREQERNDVPEAIR